MSPPKNYATEIADLASQVADGFDMDRAIPKPMRREPVEATPRKAMTPARRARVLARFDGKCSYPGCEIATGLEIDHVIALDLAGKDEDDNLAPLCEVHHAQKTRLDAKLIAKSRRLRKRESGIKKPCTLKGRGFDRSLRQRMDGTVERRAMP